MTESTECSWCPASKPPTSAVAPLAALPAESSVLLHSLTGQTALDGVAESILLADIESVCASLTGPGSPPGKREPLSPKPGTRTGHNEPRECMRQLRENLMIVGPTACVLSRDRVCSPVQTQDAPYWPSCVIPADLVLSLQ